MPGISEDKPPAGKLSIKLIGPTVETAHKQATPDQIHFHVVNDEWIPSFVPPEYIEIMRKDSYAKSEMSHPLADIGFRDMDDIGVHAFHLRKLGYRVFVQIPYQKYDEKGEEEGELVEEGVKWWELYVEAPRK